MLTITPNHPIDWWNNGHPTIREGENIQWRITSSDPALAESVQIVPSSNNILGSPQTINFVPGGANVQFATFTTQQDDFLEVDEWFSFSFNPINAVLNTTWAGHPLINDDKLPDISIKAQKATLLENASEGAFRFDVERTGADLTMVTDVQVSFAPTGQTPADEADFSTPLTPQLVRFNVGETKKTVELKIANDAEIEATETIEAQIMSATSTSPTQWWGGNTQYNPVTKWAASVALLNDDPNATIPNPDPDPGEPPVVQPPVKPPISPTPIDVFRFYNEATQSHFFTASPLEKDIIQNTLPDYRYEGPGFKAVPDQEGADDIYRFYNKQTNTHFFTPSEAERDSVIQNLSHIYNFEGTGFHASNKDGGGLTEVYRFYNHATGVHFYTPSVLEKNIVEGTLPTYQYEGVGFYVPDSASYDLIG
ncbi:MAG TPA: Calx-beta domain-containing protein [Falsiroseomonas sp.]|jgi:hypothetical protein|nr:Calx-beta domain-containing protein [Falsiroseomonas sp.]